jgi:hypothetical protein
MYYFNYLQWRGNLKCINNGKNIEAMHDKHTKPIKTGRRWHDRMQCFSLGWRQDTSYNLIDHSLICAFLEKWHEEASSFHLPFEEMTVTLDDVSCLLHLPVHGMLLSHETIRCQVSGYKLNIMLCLYIYMWLSLLQDWVYQHF